MVKFNTSEVATYNYGGPDASKFNIGPSGIVTFKSAPDFENPGSLAKNNSYSFAGTAADNAGNKTQWGLNVIVKDVYEGGGGIGQKSDMEIYHFSYKNSIEERINYIANKKLELIC